MFTYIAPTNTFFLQFLVFRHKALLFFFSSIETFRCFIPQLIPSLSPARLREMKLFLPGNFTSPALDESTAGHWPALTAFKGLGLLTAGG